MYWTFHGLPRQKLAGHLPSTVPFVILTLPVGEQASSPKAKM